jgi:fatty-acid desaturase
LSERTSKPRRSFAVAILKKEKKTNFKKRRAMKVNQNSNDSISNLYLTGTILLANIDYTGLADYAVKALVGGLIWMGFKVAGDYISERITKK